MVKVAGEVEITFFITEPDGKELDLKQGSTVYAVIKARNGITATD